LANNIPQSSVKSYHILLPSINEQREIVASLAASIRDVETQEQKILLVIARLHEYRAALITGAVAGKIDVRESTPVRTVKSTAQHVDE